MIVSVTFRHDTEDKSLRSLVVAECQQLNRFNPFVRRVQVVFCDELKNAETRFKCHVSVKGAGRLHLDEYCDEPSAQLAFNTCIDRIATELARLNAQMQKQRARIYYQIANEG